MFTCGPKNIIFKGILLFPGYFPVFSGFNWKNFPFPGFLQTEKYENTSVVGIGGRFESKQRCMCQDTTQCLLSMWGEIG